MSSQDDIAMEKIKNQIKLKIKTLLYVISENAINEALNEMSNEHPLYTLDKLHSSLGSLVHFAKQAEIDEPWLMKRENEKA